MKYYFKTDMITIMPLELLHSDPLTASLNKYINCSISIDVGRVTLLPTHHEIMQIFMMYTHVIGILRLVVLQSEQLALSCFNNFSKS
jgi:hypothetical protein